MLWIEIDNSDLRENRLGFGQRPALLLIDFVQAYTSISSRLYANGMARAVGEAGKLLSFARAGKVPIVHTNIRYGGSDISDTSVWLRKIPSMSIMKVGSPLAEFCEAVGPVSGELIVARQFPSAFFGTNLDRTLRMQGIDTIVLAGGMTSGGIRATAVDGIQHGFRVIVVRECVGDRCPNAHRINLSDIDNNYGDVVSKEVALKVFSSPELSPVSACDS